MTQPIPPSGTDWSNLFSLFGYVGLVAMAIVVGAMVYFVVKYRYRKGKPDFPIEIGAGKSRAREAVIFGAISTILLFSLAVGSFRMTTYIQYPPPASEALTINVTAFQWNFRFDYPNNVTSIQVCRVPADAKVIFNVTSIDVMHNFGLPDFRLKIDAIPGRYNIVWITTPSLDGNAYLSYQIRCYELCGSGHTYMIGNLTVMDPVAFNQWLNQAANSTVGG
jgi:cytochrome c oxidase subunit II